MFPSDKECSSRKFVDHFAFVCNIAEPSWIHFYGQNKRGHGGKRQNLLFLVMLILTNVNVYY